MQKESSPKLFINPYHKKLNKILIRKSTSNKIIFKSNYEEDKTIESSRRINREIFYKYIFNEYNNINKSSKKYPTNYLNNIFDLLSSPTKNYVSKKKKLLFALKDKLNSPDGNLNFKTKLLLYTKNKSKNKNNNKLFESSDNMLSQKKYVGIFRNNYNDFFENEKQLNNKYMSKLCKKYNFFSLPTPPKEERVYKNFLKIFDESKSILPDYCDFQNNSKKKAIKRIKTNSFLEKNKTTESGLSKDSNRVSKKMIRNKTSFISLTDKKNNYRYNSKSDSQSNLFLSKVNLKKQFHLHLK